MPTIIDVAAGAGVSIATVSRVFSQPDRVAEATRRRVLAVVEALGYAPNVAARSLRTLRAAKILLTVPDISNPFFASVIRGVEEAARDAGYTVIVGDTRHDPEIEDRYAEMLARREVDGLIFLGHRLPATLAPLLARDGATAPIVNGCEYSESLTVPSVHIDNAAASAEAIEHLVALGHTAIGIVTGPAASPISRDRLAGALAAARRHGLEDKAIVRAGDYSARSGYEQAAELVARGVTAIACFSDEMALGAISAIRAAGLSCPADVSVTGFDDLPFACYFDPPLTTIAQPKAVIGARAVDLLIAILNGDVAIERQVTLPHELVLRHSTAPARSRAVQLGSSQPANN
ncbi:LacI family transcriptional regulator [Sphingomonas sp. Leaf407]|uniref:LacI family DNA-binding transcriptional regulator n=1 Tax=unclassified Sphingomonas TaxID=196159 RepID=UPI0006F2B890|nr:MULTISPECIES: LacI family DNA-binding transcriptional regulator [unclassified Sphingomonas]KQN40895.1 LacI family transcriptional regulator [Sphingomonas sp. Leaf42]KQT30696.1 LacI family transcriptional regulator [Sphingomonas sp. Leaf407]